MAFQKRNLSVTVMLLFLAGGTCLFLSTLPASADVTFVEYGSNPVYDPPDAADKAYYPAVLYDAGRFSSRGASYYYKMWYADGHGQLEAVTYSDDGLTWSAPVQTAGISAGGYHAKVTYIAGGYSAAGGTYYYKVWYWDSVANVYSIAALRTADSPDGENWQNDQVLTQDVTMPLVTGDPSNWSAGSYGPVTVFYNSSATNAGPSPFDYTFSMYYDATTGGQEAIALGYSTDGNHWTRYGSAPVLPHGAPGAWDSDYASHGTVIREGSGVWRMWYSGSGASAGGSQGIGYATSSDGINWTRDAGNPIFSIYQGVAWRNSRSYTPAVLYSSSRFNAHGAATTYKMWFTGEASATGNRTIGYADAGACPTITVSPAVLPVPTVGVAYDQTITGGGGSPPYAFSVTSGSLPPGLTLLATGAFSGVPTSAGSYPFTVTATDATACSGTGSYTVVPACPAIIMSPAELSYGFVGAPYSQMITASGGIGPYTYSVASGSLPGGLTLSPTGLLSGQSSSHGTFTFTITARDANDCPASRTYSMEVGLASLPTPALSVWGLLLLAGFLSLTGAATLRK